MPDESKETMILRNINDIITELNQIKNDLLWLKKEMENKDNGRDNNQAIDN